MQRVARNGHVRVGTLWQRTMKGLHDDNTREGEGQIQTGRASLGNWFAQYHRALLLLMVLACAGCSDGALSTLQPAGPASASVARVWWWMLGVGTAVLIFVVGCAAWAMRSRSRRLSTLGAGRLIVGGGVVLPTVAMTALLIWGLPAGDALRNPSAGGTPFDVQVRGHQWWWEVSYPGEAQAPARDANDIHIPAGQPVRFTIESADVIHSFWVPRLGGKIDAIPGRANVLWLQADEPGEYAGTCAEFCGLEHAGMRVRVIAHAPDALPAALRAAAETAPRRVAAEATPRTAQERNAAAVALPPLERGAQPADTPNARHPSEGVPAPEGATVLPSAPQAAPAQSGASQ